MAFSQRNSAKSRTVQDVDHSGLVLFGNNSIIRHQHPDPDFSVYNGNYYQHNFVPFPPKTGNRCSPEFQDELLHQYDDSSLMPGLVGFDRRYGDESKGGLFNPHTRPPSGKMSRPLSSLSVTTGIEGTMARPNSVVSTGRPPSAGGRSTSTGTRPFSATRPVSRVSTRPSSAYNRNAGSPEQRSPESNWQFETDESDPDHEPIGDVLSRLGEYTQNFTPAMAAACTDCECESEERKLSSRLAKVYSSGSDDSQSDDDDVGVSFDVLLKTFHQYEEKGHSNVRQKAMMTLVNSYTGVDELTETQFNQMMTFLTTSVSQVKEACLVLLKQCTKNGGNLCKMLDDNILDFLHDCLCQQPLFHLRKTALPVLEAIFANPEHKAKWYEVVSVTFLPKLISMVRGQTPLDVKYAACCVFRSVCRYEEFLAFVTEQILPSVVLMRNASAKFKEVYVEILTGLIAHTEHVPSDVIDNSAIPISASIVREGPCGPQCAAIHLLSTLTTNDSGVAMVIGTNSLVAMLLCCMKESHCRKVRLNATEVIKNMCASRKLGLCKDFMLQLSAYLMPSPEQDSLCKIAASINVGMPAKPQLDEERMMWQGLEKFVDMTKAVIFGEAKVEVDDLGLVTRIHMKPCIDTCPVQLGLISHAFQVLQHVCLWPLDKSRLGFSANRVNLTTFTDDQKQRQRLSKVNRGLTQAIWDKVGTVVTDLLLSYADKFAKILKDPNKGMKSCRLEYMFEPQEITLINSLLELLLCSSLCTCVAFPELLPKLQEKPSKRRSKSATKLKSHSTTQISDNKSSYNVESRLKSQSDTAKGFAMGEEKIWNRDNPHLSNTGIHLNSHEVAVERSKAELRHKEACTERRLLRKCLYEADVFSCVCPFLMCNEEQVQVLVLQILRCLIHPLEERVTPKPSVNGNSNAIRTRPQTAGAVPNANKRLNVALYRMSPDLANIIKEALGPQIGDEESGAQSGDKRPPSGKKSSFDIPVASNGLETIQERLQEYAENNKDQDEKSKNSSNENEDATPSRKSKPVIDRCQSIAQQCREALLEGTGERLIMGIFTKSQKVKKHFVLVLHDFVHYGQSDSNMALSKYGCMPRLLDFLRVNENNELLEIIGLIIVRLLVSSDSRLKQLFNRHGGPQLLLSMVQYTNGLLKQEVSATLKSVSKEDAVRKRPVSAPVIRSTQKDRPPDIWDNIQSRWQQEDQVTHVLRQWMVEDRQHKKKK